MIQPIALHPGRTLPTIAGDSCALCRFSTRPDMPPEMFAQLNAAQREQFAAQLLCRRFPPIVTLIAVPLPTAAGVLVKPGQPQPMTFTNQTVFPPVSAELSCGEFRPKINGA